MSELEVIIKEYEEKLFQIFKRKIEEKVQECKSNNFDSIKTYIEIRKVVIELEKDINMYTGLNQINDELDERVIEYTDMYMNESINEFQRRAEQLLESDSLDQLLDEVEKIKRIIEELKEVGSESISECVVFKKKTMIKKEGI